MKSVNKNYVQNILKSAQLRVTAPRIAILTALIKEQKPMTQQQLAAKLKTKIPDKVTIYRSLKTFLEAGIVHKAYLRKRTWHFELASNCTETQCHPHFTCTGCGRDHCLIGVSVPMAKSPYKGFIFNHQQVRLEGLCPNCSSQ